MHRFPPLPWPSQIPYQQGEVTGALGRAATPIKSESPVEGARSSPHLAGSTAANWMGPTTTTQSGPQSLAHPGMHQRPGLQVYATHLSAPGLAGPLPDNQSQSTYSQWPLPQPGLLLSPIVSTTTLGGPLPGQQSWWSQMIARGLPTTSTSTTTTTVWSLGIPSSAVTSSLGRTSTFSTFAAGQPAVTSSSWGPSTFSTLAAGQPAQPLLQPPLGFRCCRVVLPRLHRVLHSRLLQNGVQDMGHPHGILMRCYRIHLAELR